MTDPILAARIYIVDDQAANLRLLERHLGRAGFEDITSFTDPHAALAAIEADEPDLLLLDLHMPGLDGFGVLDALRALLAADDFLPILVLTGDVERDARSRALAGGATDFLTKPLDAAEVVLRARNLIRTRQLHEIVRARNVTLTSEVATATQALAETAIRDQRQREALEASAHLLTEAQEIGGIGSGEWDLTTDRMRWSDEALRLFGVDAERLAGITDFLALVAPDDRSSVETGLRATLDSGRPFQLRHLIVRPDGAVRVFSSHAELVRDASGTPVRMVGTIADITEQVAAEEERARLEEGLRRSERNLAEAQRIAHIGSWEWNLETGTALRSDELHRIYGVAPGAIPGTTEAFLAFVHPDDWSRVQASERAAAGGSGRHDLDYRIVQPDGAVRILHEQGEVIRDPSGAPIRMVGTVQDITERVHLEAQRTRTARLLDELSSEIYVFDAETLRFTGANAGALRNLGYGLDELRELTPLDLKPEHTPASFAELLAPLRTGSREQVAFEAIHRRKDGSTYPVEVRVHLLTTEVPPVFVAVIQDITDRVAADEERARLVSAVEQTADSIIIHDLDGMIAYVNPAFSRLHGYAPEEVVGQSARILDSGHQDRSFWSALWASVTAGRTWTGSIVNRCKDGRLIEVESVISPVHDGKGRLTNYLQTDRDVTREHALEGALARRARESQMIEAALERIDSASAPEAIAAVACAQMIGLPNVDSAFVTALDQDHGRVLAVEGRLAAAFAPSRLIPGPRARYLLGRAAGGFWTEEWHARPEDGMYGEQVAATGLHTIVYAPLRGPRGVIGVVGFGTHDPAPDDLIEQLPALSTLASILGTLLAPGLETRQRDDAARASIQAILDAGAFAPYFQPIVELHTGAVVGYEALSMKKGRLSRRESDGGTSRWWVEFCSSLYRLLWGGPGWIGCPAVHLSRGSSSDQRARGGPAGSERLVLRQHVPDRGAELAGKLDPGDLRSALTAEALLGVLVPLAIGRMPGGVGGGLDEGPAQVLRAVLGERTAIVAAARLADDRAQPGVPGELLGGREPGDVAELGGDRVPEHPGDSGDAHEQWDIRVIGASRLQVGRAPLDLRLELVDEPQARGQGGRPGLGDGQAREQLASLRPEEVAHRDRVTERDQGGVDAVLERRPVAHEVEPEPRALALCPDGRVGQPDRRHEVATPELGEDPGVDLVGLGGQGCEALDLHRVGDLDVPARELELVVDEAGPVHRLDDRAHLLAVAGDPGDELAEPEHLRTGGGHFDRPALLVEDVHIKPLARQVQSGVQHAWASRCVVPLRTQRSHRGGPSS